MTTYTAVWDDTGAKLFEKVPGRDLIGKLPTGSREIAGYKKDKYGNLVEKRAKFHDPNTLRTFSLFEDQITQPPQNENHSTGS